LGKTQTIANPGKKEIVMSVVILNYNGECNLMECLASVFRSVHDAFEVVLIDNGSFDGSVQSVKNKFGDDPRLEVVCLSQNYGIAEPTNIGINHSKGKYIVFLNNDTIVEQHWLLELERVMENDHTIGAAQCKLLSFRDPAILDGVGISIDLHGCPMENGGRFYLTAEVDRGQFRNLSEIFGAAYPAMIVRRDVLAQTGFFDSKFVCYMEDVDLSWRIRLRGYRIVLASEAIVYHKRGSTTSKDVHHNFWLATAWHYRKNRIAMLVKNYSGATLFRQIPFLGSLYLLFLLNDIFVVRDFRALVGSIRAIAWNLKELRYLIRMRWRVQNEIRRIDDQQLSVIISKKCLLIGNYVRPALDVVFDRIRLLFA
jgi:GT2 family glycosyltransferase